MYIEFLLYLIRYVNYIIKYIITYLYSVHRKNTNTYTSINQTKSILSSLRLPCIGRDDSITHINVSAALSFILHCTVYYISVSASLKFYITLLYIISVYIK